MSGDSELTSLGPGTPCGAARLTLSKSNSAYIYAIETSGLKIIAATVIQNRLRKVSSLSNASIL